jgi:hypothetical protein
MASAVTTVDLFSRSVIEMLDNDPGSASATVVSSDGSTKQMRDMRDYEGFAAIVMPTVASSQCTLLEIVASSDSAGASNLTVIRSSGTVAADAPLADYVCLEVTADQIRECDTSGVGLRYVGARITSANAGDEHAVVYIRHSPKFPKTGLTANNIT